MPRFEPFAGVRYRDHDLSAVIAPPYDVISSEDQAQLERSSPYNAVRVELPRDTPTADRYTAADQLLRSWLGPDGPLALDPAPAFYVYRMRFTDESGKGRATTGVIGSLGLEPPGEGDVLPHERTTPKAKSDRLDLIRATRTNLSPVWGLSLAAGLSDGVTPSVAPDASAVADGVVHELWVVSDPAVTAAVAARVGSAPVVIADGHHRYEVAGAYAKERGGPGPWDSVMTFVVELAEDQLSVAAIHRLVAGFPADFDLPAALEPWFEPVGTTAVDGEVTARMVAAGALCLVRPEGALLLRARPSTVAKASHDLDSSRLDVALADLPPHELTYQHGVSNVAIAVATGVAQAGFLLRPATVAQIAAVAHARDRMPPKTTFFTPKPATGLVFRPAG